MRDKIEDALRMLLSGVDAPGATHYREAIYEAADTLASLFEERDARIAELERRVDLLGRHFGSQTAAMWKALGCVLAKVTSADRCPVCNGRDGAHESYCNQRGST